MTLLLSLGVFLILAKRLVDGSWVPEPKSSICAPSRRLYLVDDFPEVENVTELSSAIRLRELAGKYRLPILHRVNRRSGFHEFMLITVQKGSFIYVAQERRIRGSFKRTMNKTLA